MASRHRVRFSSLSIIKTATVPAALCKRDGTKQFHDSKISFPVTQKLARYGPRYVNHPSDVLHHYLLPCSIKCHSGHIYKFYPITPTFEVHAELNWLPNARQCPLPTIPAFTM